MVIAESHGNLGEQVKCLHMVAWLLHRGRQVDDAEKAVTRALGLLPKKGRELFASRSCGILGEISLSRGKRGSHSPFRGRPQKRM